MSRRNPQLPQLGYQVLLRPVSLHPVAVGAQQLQDLDVVQSSITVQDDVSYFEDAERELAAAPVASAFLLTNGTSLFSRYGTGASIDGETTIIDRL